ncbi:molybdenum cofactor biosynthesis protein B [Haloarchaeobius sp. HME9146]|uniref:MogA/MoaB family molybdenum cofactor biosynthesis protein n=1 Tax=Haloarchaeobius sp. HME9146 TaxID=2978732 RepID=UPI0021C071B4|nr:molybdenum cofactor biosynthesis protein B [Haloarchaeobius sp. HME9146]MCT9097713.1 molybdenum cofactor biosynthesis protein MoaB [Haloarchaeobius sp. HME9146]
MSEHDGDDHGHEHDHGDDQASEDEDHDHHEHADEQDHHGHEDHDHHHHHDITSLGVGVVTVSSSRSLDDDPAGDTIEATFEDEGHEVVVRELVPDEFDSVQGTVSRLTERRDVDAVVTTGGTGVTPDDVTVEAARQLFEKELPGFGELFRRFSYDDIGTTVIATRATAGISNGCPVFCLPGSRPAVELGVEDIILPEVPHLAGLAQREEPEEDDEE